MALNGTGNDLDLQKHGKITPPHGSEAPKNSILTATDNKESSKQNTEEEISEEMDTGKDASADIAEKRKGQTTEDGIGVKQESEKEELKVDSANDALIVKDLTSNVHGNQDSNDSNSSKSHGSHLSPEEKDRYAFISEQLNILNSQNTGSQNTETPNSKKDNSGKPKKTGSGKGPFGKIWSPFKRFARGIKRSHRKSPTKTAKKLKLQQKDDSGKMDRHLKQSDFENSSDEEDDDSSSDDNKWRIFEESEDEIDKTLENKADSFKLSALNVKSIIHKIITDEHVLKMVQNTVDSSDDENDEDNKEEDDGSLTFEPKMTRSKVKDFLQKQGCVPHPLGLSPVKKHDSPSFLDIDLPDDEEEDEDFNPEMVPHVDSDEDSESVMSSNVSDLGSPMPSTPRTPCVTPSVSQRFTDNEDSQSLLSPMGPPTQLPRSCNKSMLGRKYQDAVSAEEARRNQEEEELIALRTRSKCPLTDTSILELEAHFVAPDITADMYETKCDDSEWTGFLQSLTKVDTTPEDPVKDTEEDDPEYNYLEEEEQEYDKEDFRDDRAVKVSKKELNLLLDELYDAYGEADPIDMECKSAIKAHSKQIVQSSTKKQQAQSSVSKLTDYERKQIDDQMRKHVQLLTQTYVLCQNSEPEHATAGAASKMLLNELHTFASRQEMAFPGKPTLLRACTLDQAYTIVNDPDLFKGKDTMESNEERKKAIFKFENMTMPPLSSSQMEVLWTSPVFMYPHLLPHGGLFKIAELKRDRSRVKFLESEDNLLVLGLEQFKKFNNGREIIQQLLLPTKTKKQISIRIKNLSAKAAKDNPVKYFRTHKQLPPFPHCVADFDISMMKAPRDQSLAPEALPSWCKIFLSPSISDDTCCSNPACVRRRSSFTGHSQPGSAPSTPLSACTDSTQTGSSGSSGQSVDLNLIKRPGKRRLYSQKTSPLKRKGKGSFVPLKSSTLSGTQISEGRISPITIYVVDKVPVSSSGSTLTQSVSMTTSPVTNTVVTCVAPTIFLVNSALSHPGNCSTITTSSTQSVVTTPPIIISKSTPNLTSQGDLMAERSKRSGPCELQSKSTPDLHSESLTQNNETSDVNYDSCTENLGTKLKEKNMVDSETKRSTPDLESGVTSEAGGVLDPGTAGVSEKQDGTQSVTPSDYEANVSADGTSETQQVLIPDLQSRSTPDLSRSETPTNENNITLVQGPCTPLILYSGQPAAGDATPNSTHKSNTGTPVSKSAIEIMASFAPYFISPSTLLGPKTSCQCSSERKYRPVIPKLAMPASASKVSPFLDKKEKGKSSPRKRQLQQKARSILPKGFVLSTFTSPTKKAATSLVDRAKGMKSPRGRSKRLFSPQKMGAGFRNILPKAIGLSKSLDDVSRRNSELDDDVDSQKDTASEYDTQESEFMSDDMLESYDNDDDFENAEDNENFNSNALDKAADTESEDTQSEDGNETQDDGDSQEENMDVDDDEHMATLMEASTTLRFKPTKVTGGLSSLKAKRPRHKDVTLEMLAPDILESDPYRDERDTAFAQAYLLKVKKFLRDDLDKYEKFLRIMYEFNKSGQSPVKLYTDLTGLFEGFPDLVHDFAGFLLPEQAVECDCFLSHQEFVRARTFLRKLEIYFSKTPSQFQKIMRAFSRWYKKPLRKLEDLRSQVEPMLRGQRYLLEEFSLFFPNDKPPESAADDFEEIDFDKSDDESKFDGFEEVELPDEREPQGTKRCQCQCHSTGDDTYRKRKKHCLSCCLTVIDGELVYRINSKTIKKINITLGPPVKPLPTEKRETTDSTPNPVPASEASTVQETEELSDTEAAEKENIEHFDDTSQKAEVARVRVANKLRMVNKNKQSKGYQGLKDFYPWKKSTFLQRISNWSRKSKYSSKTPPHTSGSDSKPPSEQNSNDSAKSQDAVTGLDAHTADMDSGSERNITAEEAGLPPILPDAVAPQNSEIENKNDIKSTDSSIGLKENSNTEEHVVSEVKGQASTDSVQAINVITDRNTTVVDDSSSRKPVASSSDSIMASDILARAFSSAIFGEVSMDSTSVPFGATQRSPVKVSSESSQNIAVSGLQGPTSSSSTSQDLHFGGEQDDAVISILPSGPEGKIDFTVSSDSSFSKIRKSGSSGFLVGENSEEEPKEHENSGAGDIDNSVSKTENETSAKKTSGSSPRDITETSIASPFSPFSPFAQEIQNITSAKSPFACIKSPNVPVKRQTTPKLRRITPIRVKGHYLSEDESSSAFQAVAQNSPLIEDSQLKSPFDKSNLERHSSSESLNKTPTSSVPGKILSFPSNIKEQTEKLEQPLIQGLIRQDSASNSQKSVETVGSQKSVESAQSMSQKSGTSAESGSLKSDISEQRTSPVVIGHPVMHSEDANEGFIKPLISDADVVHSGILSENSLLGLVKGSCLGNENLHTISNLTNILTALEDPASQTKAGQREFSTDKKSSADDSLKTDASEVTLKPSIGEYIPQSATSIENVKRIKALDIPISRLSDSDESCSKHTPGIEKQQKGEINTSSTSHEKITACPSALSCDSNSIQGSQLDFSTFSEKRDSPKEMPRRYSGDQFTYLDDTTVVESMLMEPRPKIGETNEAESVQNDSAVTKLESDKHAETSKESKNNSLKTCKDSNADQKKCDRVTEENRSEQVFDGGAVNKSESDTHTEKKKGIVKASKNSKHDRPETTKRTASKSKDSKQVVKSNKSMQNVRTSSLSSKNDSKSGADETVKLSIEADSAETSIICARVTPRDTVSGESKKTSVSKKKPSNKTGRNSSKAVTGIKTKDKQPARKDSVNKNNKSKSGKTEKNTSKKEVKKSVSPTSNKSESKAQTGRKNNNESKDEPVPCPSSSDVGHIVRQEQSSSSISSLEATEDEMMWTKEMDQIILEGCKVHGPKDKTFTKIAKQICGVTSKQVQKRFHCLLTLLLESGSEDDTEDGS